MKPIVASASVVTAILVATSTPAPLKVEEKVPSLTREVKGKITKASKPKVVKTNETVRLTSQEFDCLAKNVYHEAGIEPTEGKIAVAQVTLNRVKDGRWGDDVCSVVYSKAQFSWTLDKKKRKSTPKGDLWTASVHAVKEFQRGVRVREVDQSNFYHADYIRKPQWAKVHKVTAVVGKHIFYKGI